MERGVHFCSLNIFLIHVKLQYVYDIICDLFIIIFERIGTCKDYRNRIFREGKTIWRTFCNHVWCANWFFRALEQCALIINIYLFKTLILYSYNMFFHFSMCCCNSTGWLKLHRGKPRHQNICPQWLTKNRLGQTQIWPHFDKHRK